jgi:hypothetical protein
LQKHQKTIEELERQHSLDNEQSAAELKVATRQYKASVLKFVALKWIKRSLLRPFRHWEAFTSHRKALELESARAEIDGIRKMHEATLNQTNIKHAEAIEQTIWKVKHALKQEYDVLLSASLSKCKLECEEQYYQRDMKAQEAYQDREVSLREALGTTHRAKLAVLRDELEAQHQRDVKAAEKRIGAESQQAFLNQERGLRNSLDDEKEQLRCEFIHRELILKDKIDSLEAKCTAMAKADEGFQCTFSSQKQALKDKLAGLMHMQSHLATSRDSAVKEISEANTTMQDQGVKIRNLEDEVEYLKKENKALTETLGKEGDKDVTIEFLEEMLEKSDNDNLKLNRTLVAASQQGERVGVLEDELRRSAQEKNELAMALVRANNQNSPVHHGGVSPGPRSIVETPSVVRAFPEGGALASSATPKQEIDPQNWSPATPRIRESKTLGEVEPAETGSPVEGDGPGDAWQWGTQKGAESGRFNAGSLSTEALSANPASSHRGGTSLQIRDLNKTSPTILPVQHGVPSRQNPSRFRHDDPGVQGILDIVAFSHQFFAVRPHNAEHFAPDGAVPDLGEQGAFVGHAPGEQRAPLENHNQVHARGYWPTIRHAKARVDTHQSPELMALLAGHEHNYVKERSPHQHMQGGRSMPEPAPQRRKGARRRIRRGSGTKKSVSPSQRRTRAAGKIAPPGQYSAKREAGRAMYLNQEMARYKEELRSEFELKLQDAHTLTSHLTKTIETLRSPSGGGMGGGS